MVIEGEHIVLRPWDVGDVESVVKYGNNRRIWRNLLDRFPHPYTKADAEAWIELNATDDTFRYSFAIAKDGECIGAASLMHRTDVHRKTVEIGYWIGEPFWGRGFVSEAVALLCTFAFTELDVARIEACVYEWNLASGRVLEKNGFELEGCHRKAVYKDGELIDKFVYGKVRA